MFSEHVRDCRDVSDGEMRKRYQGAKANYISTFLYIHINIFNLYIELGLKNLFKLHGKSFIESQREKSCRGGFWGKRLDEKSSHLAKKLYTRNIDRQ